VKDGVKTDIAKPKFIHGKLKLRLAVIANQRARKIRPDRKIEEAIHRTGCVGDIRDDAAGWALLRLSRDGEDHRTQDKGGQKSCN
jgi:hypothetical protein